MVQSFIFDKHIAVNGSEGVCVFLKHFILSLNIAWYVLCCVVLRLAALQFCQAETGVGRSKRERARERGW